MQEKTGITPACAGKRKSRSTRDKYTRDHPRMRGEKQFKAGTPMELRGSPPHARGKGDARQHAGGNVRITPACAGKRTSRNTRILQSPDHPRMRGEKCAGKKINLVHLGSPPHTRGKGGRGQQFGVRPRITPRIRGEKLSLIVMLKSALGSPPHTRGKGTHYARVLTTPGITPAYAGKRLRKPRKINVPAVPHFGFHLVSQTRKRS